MYKECILHVALYIYAASTRPQCFSSDFAEVRRLIGLRECHTFISHIGVVVQLWSLFDLYEHFLCFQFTLFFLPLLLVCISVSVVAFSRNFIRSLQQSSFPFSRKDVGKTHTFTKVALPNSWWPKPNPFLNRNPDPNRWKRLFVKVWLAWGVNGYELQLSFLEAPRAKRPLKALD